MATLPDVPWAKVTDTSIYFPTDPVFRIVAPYQADALSAAAPTEPWTPNPKRLLEHWAIYHSLGISSEVVAVFNFMFVSLACLRLAGCSQECAGRPAHHIGCLNCCARSREPAD